MEIQKKERIVLFLGAGFPMPWDAPSSVCLKEKVQSILARHKISLPDACENSGFEDIIAVLYDMLLHNTNASHQKLFIPKIEYDAQTIGAAYYDCINSTIDEVDKYENGLEDHIHLNEKVKLFFTFLSKRYTHISVYTTNYDELLPRILTRDMGVLGVKGDERFDYDIKAHHKREFSYSNLHGSIHLYIAPFDGQQREIRYSHCKRNTTFRHAIYGGNPSETDLFSPIIIGHSKTQQLLSKHFTFPLTCFISDLSECDIFLAIGSSFSDSHLNAIIRQYTVDKSIPFRIVTKLANDEVLASSPFDMKIISEVFKDSGKWTPDTAKDNIFSRSDNRLVYYKRGVEALLSDKEFWCEYLW